MAARNSLQCVDEVPLVTTHWLGYDWKRHQSGKSFRSRLDDCRHFTFSTSTSTSSRLENFNILRGLYNHACTSGGKDPRARVKRSRMREAAEELFRVVPDPDSSLGPLWECLKCHKRFSTEQGVVTHTYNLHLTNQEEGEVKAEKFVCEECGKECKDGPALLDHTTAKHGPLPTASSSDDHLSESEGGGGHECGVCGWRFGSEEELGRHLSEGWQPRDKLRTLACPQCDRSFGRNEPSASTSTIACG